MNDNYVYDGLHKVFFWRYEHSSNGGWNYNRSYNVDSWTTFGLIPLTRPYIEIAKPNYLMVNVPGSSARYDVTNQLPGGLTFGSRSGKWTFAAPPHEDFENWAERFNELKSYFDGSRFLLQLSDEPDVYYEGRLSFSSYEPGDSYSSVTIDYDLDLKERTSLAINVTSVINPLSIADQNEFVAISLFKNGRQTGVIGSPSKLIASTVGEMVNYGEDGHTIIVKGNNSTGITVTPSLSTIKEYEMLSKGFSVNKYLDNVTVNTNAFIDLSSYGTDSTILIIEIFQNDRRVCFGARKSYLLSMTDGCVCNFGSDGEIIVITGMNNSGINIDTSLNLASVQITISSVGGNLIYNNANIALGRDIDLSSIANDKSILLVDVCASTRRFGFCCAKTHLKDLRSKRVFNAGSDGQLAIVTGNSRNGFRVEMPGIGITSAVLTMLEIV